MAPLVRLSEDGFTIKMYFDEHIPPHVHVICADGEASISVKSLEVLEMRNQVPRRVLRAATQWISRHRETLLGMWDRRLQAGGIHVIEDKAKV